MLKFFITALVDIYVRILVAYFQSESGNSTSITERKELDSVVYVVPRLTTLDPAFGYAFEVPRMMKSIVHKRIISIQLTCDSIEDAKRLSLIQIEARRLKYTDDTSQVLRVFIPDNSEYRSFLSLLYLMKNDHHSRYFEYRNWFYILSDVAKKKINTSNEVKSPVL